MCGHGSIGLASAMVNLKLVDVKEPETKVVLDTPAGIVTIKVQVEDGEAVRATVQNVPAFVYAKELKLHLPSLGKNFNVDICFGGSFFVMLDAKDFGLELNSDEADLLRQLGHEVLEEANKQFSVQHPLTPQNNRILLAEFGLEKEKLRGRNCVVFGASNIDRSPCGTGTSAKMALLASRGRLAPGEVFSHESIIDTVFDGSYEETTKVGPFEAIIPCISGEANITGFNWLIEQNRDILLPGFSL